MWIKRSSVTSCYLEQPECTHWSINVFDGVISKNLYDLIARLNGFQLPPNMAGGPIADEFAIACVGDMTAKVFHTRTGDLLHSLEGHTWWIYTLELSPTQPDIMMTAGHDGHVCA